MISYPVVSTRNSTPDVLFPVPCAGNVARRQLLLSPAFGSVPPFAAVNDSVVVPSLAAVPLPTRGTSDPVVGSKSNVMLLKSHWARVAARANTVAKRNKIRISVVRFMLYRVDGCSSITVQGTGRLVSC